MSALDLYIAAVKMTNKSNTYAPSCFKVALYKKDDGYTFVKKAKFHKPPNMQQEVLESLRSATDITGISAHLISVLTREDRFALLYVVPVPTTTSGACTKENIEFVNVNDLVHYPEQLEEFERDLVQYINQWLYEKHTIPFINLDTLFSNDGALSVVNEIVHNPLHQAHVHPPEDTLVISFNNPLFPLNNDKN